MPSAVHEQRRRLLFSEVSRVVPGLYGWLATVALPVAQPGAPLLSRLAALAAVAALGGSFLVSSTKPRLSRWLGVYLFVLTCFLAWAALGARLRSDQVDAVRGALGAVGFLLHALAWGAPPKNPDADDLDNLVSGQPLQARHQPVRAGVFVLGLGIAVGLAPLVVAFRVERPGASLLAQAMALGCGIVVIGASADVALRIGKAHTFAAWRVRSSRAVWPLGILTLALGIGLVWLALH
jgi:hypothetical protein